MDAITLTILIVAILALSGWGYGYYTRPATGAVVETGAAPAPAGSPGLSLLGIIGLIFLVAFVVMLATGWRFGMQVQPPA